MSSDSRIFYNLEITNDTTTPVQCTYDVTFNNPLINNVADWEAGVIRMRIPTSGIPLMSKNIPFEQLEVALEYGGFAVTNYVSQVGAVMQPRYGFTASNGVGYSDWWLRKYSVDENGVWVLVNKVKPSSSLGINYMIKLRQVNRGNKLLLIAQQQSVPHKQVLIETDFNFSSFAVIKTFGDPISEIANIDSGLTVDEKNDLIMVTPSDGMYYVFNLKYELVYSKRISNAEDVQVIQRDIAVNGSTLRMSFVIYGTGIFLTASDYTYVDNVYTPTGITSAILSHVDSTTSLAYHVVWNTDRFYVVDNIMFKIYTYGITHSTLPIATFTTGVTLSSFSVDLYIYGISGYNIYKFNKSTGVLISTMLFNEPVGYSDSTVVPSQDEINYNPVFKLWDILAQVNMALSDSFTELQALVGSSFPVGLTTPPSVSYNASTKLFSWIGQQAFLTNNLKVYFNVNLNDFFQFTSITESSSLIPPEYVQLVLQNRFDNNITINSILFYQMTQEASTIYKINQLNRIIIGSNSLPVRGDNQGQTTQRIITDLYPDISTIGSNDVLFYNASALRFYPFYSDMPLSRIDIQLYYADVYGDQYPLMISPDEMASIKIEFRKRGDNVSVW